MSHHWTIRKARSVDLVPHSLWVIAQGTLVVLAPSATNPSAQNALLPLLSLTGPPALPWSFSASPFVTIGGGEPATIDITTSAGVAQGLTPKCRHTSERVLARGYLPGELRLNARAFTEEATVFAGRVSSEENMWGIFKPNRAVNKMSKTPRAGVTKPSKKHKASSEPKHLSGSAST